MTSKMRKAILSMVVLLTSACGPSGVDKLDEREWASIDRNREHIDTTRIATLPKLFELTLPDTAPPQYALDTPMFVAISKRDSNVVLVGDRLDRVVHLFRTDGRYLGTRTSAAPSVGPIEAMITGTSTPAGTIFVTDLRTGTLVRLDSGATGARVALGVMKRGFPFGSQVESGDNGALYENWSFRNVPDYSPAWSDTASLVRSISPEGKALARFGSVKRYSGVLFTAALNRGILRYFRDTLWFARRSDASLLAFAAAHPSRDPVRTVALPLFFQMTQPKELVDAKRDLYNVRVESHLVAFAMSPDGEFLAAQTVSYPTKAGAPFQPRTALTVECRDGTFIGAYDLGADIIDLAATRQRVFAVVQENRTHSRRVIVYPNPLAGMANKAGAIQRCNGGAHV